MAHIYKIYLEPADTDTERVYLGSVEANSVSEALDLGAQWNEIPQHDLIALLDEEPALVRCVWCGQFHQVDQVDQCPLKPRHE